MVSFHTVYMIVLYRIFAYLHNHLITLQSFPTPERPPLYAKEKESRVSVIMPRIINTYVRLLKYINCYNSQNHRRSSKCLISALKQVIKKIGPTIRVAVTAHHTQIFW
jgi:hypothetical protein